MERSIATIFFIDNFLCGLELGGTGPNSAESAVHGLGIKVLFEL